MKARADAKDWMVVALHAAQPTAGYWKDPTLNELEQRLDAARFFRISSAAVISLNAVAEVFPMPGGSAEVMLKNGHRMEVSRRRFRELLPALEAR